MDSTMQSSSNRPNNTLTFLHYDTLSAFRSLEQLSQALINNPTRNSEIADNSWVVPRWTPQYQIRENAVFETTQCRIRPLQYKYVETSKTDPRFLLNQYRNNADRNYDIWLKKKQLLSDCLFETVRRELDRRRNGLKSDTIAVDSALVALKKLQFRK